MKECTTDGDEVPDQMGEQAIGEQTLAHVIILLEAFERHRIGANNAQRSIG